MLALFGMYGASAALIVVAGVYLVKAGDEIADCLALSHMWLGAILIASVTSLPEFVTTITSIRLNLPDMAVSNIMGSNFFNLAALSAIFLVFPFGRQVSRAENLTETRRGCHCVILLTGIMAACIFIKLPWRIMSMGVDSLCVLMIYGLFVRVLFEPSDTTPGGTISHKRLVKPMAIYVLCAMGIVAGGIWNVRVLKALMVYMGWPETFVGLLFLAIATSLPELVVLIQSLRLASFTMLMGVIMGSNLFNICIIACGDIWAHGNIFTLVSAKLGVACLCLTGFSALFLPIIYFKSGGRFLALKKVSVIVILGYVVAILASYRW